MTAYKVSDQAQSEHCPFERRSFLVVRVLPERALLHLPSDWREYIVQISEQKIRGFTCSASVVSLSLLASR